MSKFKTFPSATDVDSIAKILIENGFGETDKGIDKKGMEAFRGIFFKESSIVGGIGNWSGLTGDKYQIQFNNNNDSGMYVVKIIRLQNNEITAEFTDVTPKKLPWKN